MRAKGWELREYRISLEHQMVAQPAAFGHTCKATPQKPIHEVRKGPPAHTGAKVLLAAGMTLGLSLQSPGLYQEKQVGLTSKDTEGLGKVLVL